MVQIKRIGVLSAAKIMGILYACGGLIAGAIFSLMAVVGVTADSFGAGGGSEGAVAGIAFGVGAIICFPLLYGALGFVAGVITAFIYNFAAGIMGGIEVELGE